MNAPLVECVDVVKVLSSRKERTVAVNDVSFELQAGETVALMGPSGGGKSTLLSLLGLLSRPSTGTVRVDGTPAPDSDAERARLRNGYFGYVHQEHAVIAAETALTNVCVPLEYRRPRLSAQERRARGAEVLAQVGLQNKMERRARDLSGGERQRVAIARCLTNRPRVVLADEPTAALDTTTGSAILELLIGASATGAGVVIATHDYRVADRCDRVALIRDGRLDLTPRPVR